MMLLLNKYFCRDNCEIILDYLDEWKTWKDKVITNIGTTAFYSASNERYNLYYNTLMGYSATLERYKYFKWQVYYDKYVYVPENSYKARSGFEEIKKTQMTIRKQHMPFIEFLQSKGVIPNN